MKEENFLDFVTRVDWCFAKSVPNWPHFYIVERELDDQEAYAATRSFIRISFNLLLPAASMRAG